MPSVALLGLDQCYSSSLSGMMDILQIANHAQRHLGESFEPFEWVLLSEDGSPITTASGTLITPDGAIENSTEKISNSDRIYDVIYIPGVPYGDEQHFKHWLQQQASISNWLRSQWLQGSTIASVCTGTFLLASTQLLDYREATTTWWLEQAFRRQFPSVCLNIRQMVTEQDRLICAGAITSYQQLTLRLIERYFSPRIASFCAKALLIDIGQNAQAPYASLFNTHEHNDALVSKAQDYLQQHLAEKITIKGLASELYVCQRTLIRRCKKALGMSPSTYLQNLRLEAAKHLLESTNKSVESIIYQVGYSDSSSFTRLFHRRTELTPTAYRERLRQVV